MSSFGGSLYVSRPRVGQSLVRRYLARFDWTLFIAVAVLGILGLLNLYSATYRTPHSIKFDRQLIWMGIGITTYLVTTAIDYRMLHKLAWIGLGVGIAAIILVRLLADPHKGSTRWLEFGALRIQPSEFVKIAVIVALGRFLHDRDAEEGFSREMLPYLAALLLPVFLVAWQPDLGSSLLTLFIMLSVSFLLVKKLLPLTVSLVAGLAALPLLWEVMHDYQRARVLSFLDPSADPTGAGWHTQQSIFAVGSGRLSGKGFLNATQNHFNFLPEHWTDFPFSVWAEEWGFIGSVVLLLLVAFILLWIVNVAMNARDTFGTAICLGVAAMVFWHTIVNIAMVVGMAPVVGVTLPLVSYGGSSVVSMFLALGLVSSVSMRRHGF